MTIDEWLRIISATGATLAAFFAIAQWRAATSQRKLELRFRQAEQGKKIYDEIVQDVLANNALFLLESSRREYRTSNETVFVIEKREVLDALRAGLARWHAAPAGSRLYIVRSHVNPAEKLAWQKAFTDLDVRPTAINTYAEKVLVLGPS